MHRFAADQNVECTGIKDNLTVCAVHVFPIFSGVVMADIVQIDDTRVRFGAVADQVVPGKLQIDGKPKPVIDHGVTVHQAVSGVQLPEGCVVSDCWPLAKTDLVQPHAGAHKNRKRARANLGVKRAVVASGIAVKFVPAIGDRARQQDPAALSSFWHWRRLAYRRAGQALPSKARHRRTLFPAPRHRSDQPVHLELFEPVCTFAPCPQERRAHTVGHCPKRKSRLAGWICAR